jgi:hypothetical protein
MTVFYLRQPATEWQLRCLLWAFTYTPPTTGYGVCYDDEEMEA